MISKVLIANRGEIAVRIIRTCRRLGIATVAVHSDADKDALFVDMADEAVSLGGQTASESYLRGDLIIEATRRTGADAVHPGYGFLSENPDFAEAVTKAGIRFIGPPASAIRAMGLKDAAKAAMEQAGVPVVPGYHGESRDPAVLLEEARRIGFPVLIKARAGGGGKGMRRVERPEDFLAALESAEREGQASFGDPACLIEKYVSHPRHIEIQVFADDHGNVVHLFERDCSAQRRHQKVIEEAPAPGMPPEMRQAMGEAAVRAARAIGYSGAGTIEFIADASEGLRMDRFWFMEMNTRLQVEHPVTEAITGQDLVEWQLRVASGEPLPLRQEDLSIEGWSFEARLYAENPAKGFLPSTGTITHLHLPEATARIDSGIREGDTITPFYDPMIAKVIVHGKTRADALAKLLTALDGAEVAGVETNSRFLARLARHPDFADGRPDTGLIARAQDALVAEDQPSLLEEAVAAIVLSGLHQRPADADPWSSLAGFRLWGEAEEVVLLEGSHGPHCIRLLPGSAGQWQAKRDDETVSFRLKPLSRSILHVESDGHSSRWRVLETAGSVELRRGSRANRFRLHDPLEGSVTTGAGGDTIAAPMPGLVKRLMVETGQIVKAGEPVAMMEAMKMELTLAAPFDGKVRTVGVSEGQQVGEGTLIATFDAAGES
ncbi:ATP-binding protein [Gellertiella hungarica]|uniref:3-methylcrotonyl-CoA carboxylase alpha subunit n=1 Tax=Gellertiella hungarica TaxID=1572859 RepID=A0A7W6J924_9HYPH|nr:3-methylcrotonyl-CoA carboxylase alpha subunit [Gellertiella hungarica]